MKNYWELLADGWTYVGFASAMMPWYAVCNLACEHDITPQVASGLIVGWPPGQSVFRIVPGQSVADKALGGAVTR